MITVIIIAKQIVTVDSKYSTPENPLGVIENGAIVFQDDKIQWLGTVAELDRASYSNATTVDANDQIVLPGLIDSHTHPVFAGDRAKEFEMRLEGKTYQEIAEAGGGILNTVRATREASEDQLYDLAKARLSRMLGFGVTTVEAKSGYGLDWESELKSLRVIRRLKETLPLTVVSTYMGAHDIPPEYKNKTDAYVTLLCEKQLPQVAELGLAEFCDVFCETGYFSVAQSRQILETAKNLGFGLKIHAEEFNDIGGAVLAGELQASSADHLLNISAAGIQSLKQGGTVATLLPGTAFYLRLPYAPARKILDAGVPVAIATDFNPGSCNTENLQLMMTLACLQMRMTPAEVICAVTLNAAQALNLAHDRGSLSVGKRADCVLMTVSSYQELLYHYGVNFVSQVFVAGQRVI